MEQQKEQPASNDSEINRMSEDMAIQLTNQFREIAESSAKVVKMFNDVNIGFLKLQLSRQESLYLLSYSKCVFYRLKRERSFFIVRCYWNKKLGDEIKNLKMKHRTVMYIKSVLK